MFLCYHNVAITQQSPTWDAWASKKDPPSQIGHNEGHVDPMAHYGGYAMAVPHGYAQAPLYFQGAAFFGYGLPKDLFVTYLVRRIFCVTRKEWVPKSSILM